MEIIDQVLENTCKNMIKTMLFCLEHATKGTIYRVGPMPKLQTVRISSGMRKEDSEEIQWGLPSSSDYSYPGKSWEQYRDRPDSVLEAMGWCVEKQRCWTADNPFEDVRSVRKQLRGELEDCYHMEPVLVRKIDLCGNCLEDLDYPVDWRGNPIWQDMEYVVVAVIKIHFKPNTLRREDRNTTIIHELSRTLGTELLSLHLRETLSQAQKEFARQRLQSCKILAHDLRNTLVKFGFLFSAVNAQISILREEWETLLQKEFPQLEWKSTILRRLSEMIRERLGTIDSDGKLASLSRTLLAEQEELDAVFLLPVQAEQWVWNKILPKWERLLAESQVWSAEREEIRRLLKQLAKALWLGTDEELAGAVPHLPEMIRTRWRNIAYTYFNSGNLSVLGEILDFLEDPLLPMPHKFQTARLLKSLKALIEVVPEVEERANKIIFSLRNGNFSDLERVAGFDSMCGCGTSSRVASDWEASFSTIE